MVLTLKQLNLVKIYFQANSSWLRFFSWPKFFCSQILLYENILDFTFYSDNISFGPYFYWTETFLKPFKTKFFLTKFFLEQNFFGPKIFLNQIILDQNFFCTKLIFGTKFFFGIKILFGPMFFGKTFCTKIEPSKPKLLTVPIYPMWPNHICDVQFINQISKY